jgi:hypothetical protein
MIGLGLGIGISQSLGFNIASIFANGEQGVVFDPYDLTSIYQDAAGTIPATAYGQKALKLLDLSGNNHHAVETVAGKAPVLMQRGPLFLGAQALATDAINFSGTNVVTVVMEIRKLVDSTAVALETGQSVGSFVITAPNGASSKNYGFSAKGTLTATRETSAISAITSNVISCVFDLSGDVVANEIKPRIDGAVPDLTAIGTSSGNGPFGNYALTIGSRSSQTSLFLQSGIGRIVAIGRELNSAELANVEAWVRSTIKTTIIASVGDSTVAAYNSRLSLVDLVGCQYAQIAVPGNTIAQQKTAWVARVDKATFGAVVVQVGLNDLNPAEAASVAIARLQDLIDTINTDVSVPVYIAKMIPCRQRLIDLYGATDGPIAYQKWIDMNDAIAGNGSTPITGVDGRITAHEPLMNDGSGNLLAAYDSGDGIHPNNNGRAINAAEWNNALAQDGIL